MKTAWLCFALIACGKSARQEQAPRKKKQYAKDGIVAYHQKLGEAHLEPLKLDRVETKIADPAHDKAPDPGSTLTTKDGVFIVGKTFRTDEDPPPADLDIAIDSGTKVFVIERVPQVIPDPYRACECVPQKCSTPGAETIRVLYGPLPKDVTVLGSKPIEFPEHRLAPNYVDKNKLCECPAAAAGSGSSAMRGTPDAGVP